MALMPSFISSWERQGLLARTLTQTERDRLCAEYENQVKQFSYSSEHLAGIVIGVLLIPLLVGFVVIYFVDKSHRDKQDMAVKEAYEKAVYISHCEPYNG
jgi:hypothetical protein